MFCPVPPLAPDVDGTLAWVMTVRGERGWTRPSTWAFSWLPSLVIAEGSIKVLAMATEYHLPLSDASTRSAYLSPAFPRHGGVGASAGRSGGTWLLSSTPNAAGNGCFQRAASPHCVLHHHGRRTRTERSGGVMALRRERWWACPTTRAVQPFTRLAVVVLAGRTACSTTPPVCPRTPKAVIKCWRGEACAAAPPVCPRTLTGLNSALDSRRPWAEALDGVDRSRMGDARAQACTVTCYMRALARVRHASVSCVCYP
ncbi:unnamed protein product [Sphacelaria rigidula]